MHTDPTTDPILFPQYNQFSNPLPQTKTYVHKTFGTTTKTKPTFGLFCSCENKVKQLDKTSKRSFFKKT
jgi:hypothetical protein